MKELELTPRLMAIADQVPPGAKLADVGTDHAYLPVYLLLNGRIQSAVASDVNAGPFYKAILWAAEQGVTTGYEDGSFRPNSICTRGHIVTFLYRAK
jgi:tRNA (adenine22-N1)-methyltransferase